MTGFNPIAQVNEGTQFHNFYGC